MSQAISKLRRYRISGFIDKTGNVRINGILMRIRLFIVAVENYCVF
jgi:hypothetical protein